MHVRTNTRTNLTALGFTLGTAGTSFHLLEDTAHPCLSISSDGLTMFYTDEDLPLSGMVFSDNTFARYVLQAQAENSRGGVNGLNVRNTLDIKLHHVIK